MQIYCEYSISSIRKFLINTISVSWIHEESSMNSLSSPEIHYLFRAFILNPLSFLRKHFETTMKSIFIHYLFREFTICFATCLSKHCLLYDFTLNSLSFSRKLTLNSLYISRFYYESTIYFGNSLWIRYLFRDFTMDSLSFSRNHCEFTFYFENISFCFAISLNSLSVSLIHYSIAICLVNSLYIKNHFRGFSLKEILFSRINSEFIIYFPNSTWICYLYSKSFTYNDSFT